jgi:hypothetical protein
MERDPIVEEVRRAREQLLEQAGGDLDRLLDMLQQSEITGDRPVVSRTPKKSEGAPEAAA